MKKDDALNKLGRAGDAIHDLNATAWNTALNPSRHGWGSSLLSVATLPVLGAASLGHLVSTVVVRQINPKTFEKITGVGRREERGG